MTSTAPAGATGMSRVRWTVCALLFFATTISYVDRQVLSVLAKTLETKIGWNSIQYGYITAAFQFAYAVGLLVAGRLIDWMGTRKGFALAVGLWSAAALSHAAAVSAFTFGIARVALGLGESANFPACIKTVAEWFPKRERALATGIFNSGANIGAIGVLLVVPWLANTYGWQAAFIMTGTIGFVWVALWLFLYVKPAANRRVSKGELNLIQSDPPDSVESVPWRKLFPERSTWVFGLGKFLTDPVWSFFLFWLPKYLQETFGLSLTQIVLPTLVVYNLSTIGSVGGGWLSSGLIGRGWKVGSARNAAMLTCALLMLPVLYAPYCKSLWVVVVLIGIGMAAHQGWSANLFTLVSDTFPRAAVGSVIGIGGTMGSIGVVLMNLVTGYVVQLTHSYLPLFIFSGTAYLVALVVMRGIAPRESAQG